MFSEKITLPLFLTFITIIIFGSKTYYLQKVNILEDYKYRVICVNNISDMNYVLVTFYCSIIATKMNMDFLMIKVTSETNTTHNNGN